MLEKIKKDYKVIRKIGYGGMAEIFLVQDKISAGLFALKILRSERKVNPLDRKRFKQEIETMEHLRRIDSPYLIKIKDFKFDQVSQYLIMEYIDGHTLKNYISKRSVLTPDEAVEFVKQIALGIHDTHKAKIIHRDIKSSNIMIYGHGKVKIIDLGIALSEQSERFTKVDSVIGSVHYLAPELLAGKDADIQTDVYAVGVILFEMLTGNTPFEHEKEPLKIALKHKNHKIPAVNKINDSVPQALANVVARATAKNRQYRYKNLLEFYNDVKTSLNISRMTEKPLNFDKKVQRSGWEIFNSRAFLIVLFGLLIVAVALVITILLLVL